MDKLRWGIMGTGNIARTFARAVMSSQTGNLAAVGSRTQESADTFGAEFEIESRHGSYQALVDDPQVQAIYISLPNHLHAEWTIRCAEAGKHILCEKPLTTNHAEAMRVIEAVRRQNVFMMEAFMYRCHPQTRRLKQLIEEKAIGEVRLIQSSFSYNMGPRYENIRLSNPAAGGGMMDVGCYAVSMARLVAGTEPLEVRAAGHIGSVSRVDEWSAATLRFPGDVIATVNCGTQVAVDSELRIWGSEGSIRVPNPWFPGEGSNKIIIQKTGEKDPTEILVEGGSGLYSIEADTVARSIPHLQAEPPCMTWDDSLGNMAVLDAWRKSVGLVFDVEKPEALTGPPPPVRSDAAMKYGRIAGIERPVSRMIMGSMAFSPDRPTYYMTMLDDFVAHGGNCIDTAVVYGTESSVGEWMRLRKNRDQIILIAKGAHHGPEGPRVNPECIAADLRGSMQRLGTDYVDLYLLHRDDPAFPVGEIVECLNQHHREGRMRAFGGSNWTVERLEEANAYALAHGLVPFAASSPNFSLAVPKEPRWAGCVDAASRKDREWYRQHQLPLLSWSSQAGGFFSGRFGPGKPADAEMTRVWYTEENFERLRRAEELGRQKGVTAIQIAFAYVLSQPFPTFALVGPRTLEETRTSAEGLVIDLTPDEVAWLNLEA